MIQETDCQMTFGTDLQKIFEIEIQKTLASDLLKTLEIEHHLWNLETDPLMIHEIFLQQI